MVSPLEMRRKIFHMSAGVFLIFLFYNNILIPVHFFILLFLGSILSLVARSYRIPIVEWFLMTFDRPEKRKTFPGKGAWFFVLGFFLSSILFEKQIALAAMVVLSLGDALSHLVGASVGQIKHPLSDKKFVEGHIAGAFVSGLGASLFVSWPMAFSGALLALFAEGIDDIMNIDPVDDNVVIPLVAGSVMSLLMAM